MYHRIAEPETDVWDIAVSPTAFEQQAKFLQQNAHVIPVSELLEALTQKAIKRNTVVITFDDGYADNYLVAKPILDHYGLPATFFIPSQTIDKPEEFWWDELEAIILSAEHLPASFASTVGAGAVTVDLGNEAHLSDDLRRRHQQWKAGAERPPTLRSALFFRLWQLLRPLPYPEQQRELRRLRQWGGVGISARPAYRTMSRSQLQSLSRSPLHELGAHTCSHPALACHSAAFQKLELADNKKYLEQVVGRTVTSAAYPYGNYNEQTLESTAEVGFKAGFTTEEKVITTATNTLQLGRFQVKNNLELPFAQQLYGWQTSL